MSPLPIPTDNPLTTALVVDDDAFSRAIAQRALSRLGFTVCVMAQDGVEGLQHLAKMARAPDLILCDIFMPNKDGIEFLEALAQRGFQGHLILLSGGDCLMMAIAGRLASYGGLHVTAQLAKPLDMDQLAQAIGITQGA